MLLIDYKKGIHPDSGKTYQVINDIIVTPFWTPEFCSQIVEIANHYSDRFSKDVVWYGETAKNIGWNDLLIETISPVFFQEFVEHYRRLINPLLGQVYTEAAEDIKGWFSPYIIRYDKPDQSVSLHNDASYVTLNLKLNNDYEGCDLIFPRQNFNANTIPVGYAMIWPSAVTHPHYSTPLTSGTKYSIVSWTWPPEWTKKGIQNW
jgi:hypothetical protein